MTIWDNGLENSSLMHVRDQMRSYHASSSHIRTSSCEVRDMQKIKFWDNSPTQIYMARVFLADLMGHAVRRWTAHAQPELFSHC